MNLYQRKPEPPCPGVTITQGMVDGTEPLPPGVERGEPADRLLFVRDCTGLVLWLVPGDGVRYRDGWAIRVRRVLWERDWVRVEEGDG